MLALTRFQAAAWRCGCHLSHWLEPLTEPTPACGWLAAGAASRLGTDACVTSREHVPAPWRHASSQAPQVYVEREEYRRLKDLEHRNMSFTDYKSYLESTFAKGQPTRDCRMVLLVSKVQDIEQLREAMALLKRNRFLRTARQWNGMKSTFNCRVAAKLLWVAERAQNSQMAVEIIESLHEVGLKPRNRLFLRALKLAYRTNDLQAAKLMHVWYEVFFGAPSRRSLFTLSTMYLNRGLYSDVVATLEEAQSRGVELAPSEQHRLEQARAMLATA